MYSNKMALAVKVPSRNKHSVAREVDDAVYLPFGCEYSLLIKNLNTVKALVRVWIDGTDVTDGTSLVVGPNSSIDLERFIKNGNMDEGNKFKFIERIAAISQHRGNKIDDGLIRVEFEFAIPQYPRHYPNTIGNMTPTWPGVTPNDYTMYNQLLNARGFAEKATFSTSSNVASGSMSDFYDSEIAYAGATAELSTQSNSSPLRSIKSEVGITVPGSVSDQKFTTAAWFATDGVKHSMVLRVLGEAEGQPVVEPITVKHKVTCASCGRVNKAGAKFCSDCGTALQII